MNSLENVHKNRMQSHHQGQETTTSMRIRRRDGQQQHVKFQSVEVDEEGNCSASNLQTPTNLPNFLHKSLSKRICASNSSFCAIFLRILLGMIVILFVLNFTYLEYKAITFGNPCQIAHDIKEKLKSSPRKINNQTVPPLPKIIHQQWKTDKIPDGVFTEYNNQWKKLFPEPEYKHMLWTDQTGRQLIADHFPWFLEAFDGYHMNIQRADAVRYFILYKHGGLYADLDYEPFVNFWHALPHDRVSLIESPYKVNEQVQNSLMSSPASDPFWNVTFDVLNERRGSHKVLSSTGPAAMDAAMDKMIATSTDEHNRNFAPVHILPCENFHRIPLAAAGTNSPLITRFARTVMAYSPMVKTCGDWTRRDDCQYGLHHNSVSYMSNMGSNLWTILRNF